VFGGPTSILLNRLTLVVLAPLDRGQMHTTEGVHRLTVGQGFCVRHNGVILSHARQDSVRQAMQKTTRNRISATGLYPV
jgi:hypothetical protein